MIKVVLQCSLFAASIVGLGACGDGCGNAVKQRLRAPDGEHDAVVFVRDCGATTALSTQVSIVGPDENPVSAGNVLVTVLANEQTPFKIRWLAPDRLLIALPPAAQIFRQEAKSGEISLEYLRGS